MKKLSWEKSVSILHILFCCQKRTRITHICFLTEGEDLSSSEIGVFTKGRKSSWNWGRMHSHCYTLKQINSYHHYQYKLVLNEFCHLKKYRILEFRSCWSNKNGLFPSPKRIIEIYKIIPSNKSLSDLRTSHHQQKFRYTLNEHQNSEMQHQ